MRKSFAASKNKSNYKSRLHRPISDNHCHLAVIRFAYGWQRASKDTWGELITNYVCVCVLYLKTIFYAHGQNTDENIYTPC